MKEPKAGAACVVCGKKLSPVGLQEKDPFCSTGCCRTWHDAAVAKSTGSQLPPKEKKR